MKRMIFLCAVVWYACTIQTTIGINSLSAQPNVTVRLSPVESDAIVYQEVAPAYKGGQVSAQVALFMTLQNHESSPVKVSKIELRNSQVSKSFQVGEYNNAKKKRQNPMPPGKYFFWLNNRGYNQNGDILYLKKPFPTTQTVKIFFEGYAQPIVITKPLKPYKGTALQFPGRPEELEVNEYWSGQSRHKSWSGNVFGLDLAVKGWDGKRWNKLKPGTDGTKNEHFRIYGKRVYAMADGTVSKFKNTHPDNPAPHKIVDKSPAGGNFFKINHGDVTIDYSHFQKGTLNPKLLKKGAKVKKGDFLGIAGNSGNSSGPHLHIHPIQNKGKINWRDTRPLRLYGADVVGQSHMAGPHITQKWVRLNYTNIPQQEALIRPSSSLKWKEYSRFGLPAAYYQGEFDKMARAGYYPTWVQGFESGGRLYFNVIFNRSGGKQWVARHGLDGNAYQREFTKYTKAGYRLTHVDSYISRGRVRYAAVFMKKSGPGYMAYHGVNGTTHQQRFSSWAKKGWTPTHISVVSHRGKKYYTAIYEKKNVSGFYHFSNMNGQAYQAKYNELAKKGFQPVYIDVYRHGSTPYFSVIWYRRPPFSKHAARHGLNNRSFQQAFSQNTRARYYSRCLVGYQSGKYARYAGLWTRTDRVVRQFR